MPRGSTVALQVRGPQQVEGGGSVLGNINPFQAGVDIMRMQELGNEVRKQNLEFQANAAIGDMIAGGATLDDVAKSKWAPYAAGFISTMKQVDLASAQIAQAQASTGKTNLEARDTVQHIFIKNMIPYWDAVRRHEPQEVLDGIRDAAIQQTTAATAGMTRDMQASAIEGMRAVFQGWTTGLPENTSDNPYASYDEQSKRIGMSLTTAGIDAPSLEAATGKFTTIDTPQGTYFGNASPLTGFQPHGMIPHGVAPGYAEPGRALYPGVGTGLPSESLSLQPPPIQPVDMQGRPITGVGGANQLQPPQPPGPEQPSVQPPPDRMPQPASPPGPRGVAMSPQARDGQPLWNEEVMRQPAAEGTMDAAGTRFVYRNPGQEDMDKKLTESYGTKEREEFNDNQKAVIQLELMDNSIDKLAGTPLETGAFGEARTEAANVMNTGVRSFNSIFGTKLGDIIDPKSVAEGQALIKEMRLAQFATVRSQFGAQREAGSVIMAAAQAVPGISNSYLGNKMVLEALRTTLQRGEDMYRFKGEWANRHNGSLIGADAAFEKMHPAEQYAQTMLQKFGLTKEGFTNRAAVLNANSHGWIDPGFAQSELQRLRNQPANP